MALIDQLSFVTKPDPLGNGQETVEVAFAASDGGSILTGLYLCVHGGGPMNYRVVHGNPVDSPNGTAVGDVFELDNGKVAIAEQ